MATRRSKEAASKTPKKAPTKKRGAAKAAANTPKKNARTKGSTGKAAPRKKPAKTGAAQKKPAKKRAAQKKPRLEVAATQEGYSTVVPEMTQEDAAATIRFCEAVFGARLRGEMMRSPDGKIMHAEITIGDSVIMLSDPMMNESARVSSLFVYVGDVDATVEKAEAVGSTVVMAPENMFWGDRFARVRDPQGNYWSIATHVEDVSDAEVKRRAQAMFEAR